MQLANIIVSFFILALYVISNFSQMRNFNHIAEKNLHHFPKFTNASQHSPSTLSRFTSLLNL